VLYEYPYPLDENGEQTKASLGVAMDQEHVDLVSAIRNGEQIVQAEETAKSTLSAIMGREAAYTGKLVTWEDMMGSDMKLGPDKIEMGPVEMEYIIPQPGSPPKT
jgi:hypothetical protein